VNAFTDCQISRRIDNENIRLITYAKDLARSFRTHHVLVPWGDDLTFASGASKQFDNMDKIIKVPFLLPSPLLTRCAGYDTGY